MFLENGELIRDNIPVSGKERRKEGIQRANQGKLLGIYIHFIQFAIIRINLPRFFLEIFFVQNLTKKTVCKDKLFFFTNFQFGDINPLKGERRQIRCKVKRVSKSIILH